MEFPSHEVDRLYFVVVHADLILLRAVGSSPRRSIVSQIMNAHPELRTNVQHDFDVFSKESLKKVVEAAARVRDITGIENDEDEVFEEQVRQLCKLEVEASASLSLIHI